MKKKRGLRKKVISDRALKELVSSGGDVSTALQVLKASLDRAMSRRILHED